MISGTSRRACPSPRSFQQVARGRRILSKAVRHSSQATVAQEQDVKTESSPPNESPALDLLQPGKQISGFTLRRVKDVPELELQALHWVHNKTGGQYLHLAKDDPNNVFSIGFKTNPPDRTGVPHILEHTTLCGSEKYPVRDPFFKMMPRSLNNFMNAMTYPDHTVYPFATTNPQDFRNLVDVYLDSTLHPLLRENDFLQEGWRIGPQDASAPTSAENPLIFKGVVYNEMKGNMSSADYLFRQRWQDHIFPSINDSGGDPQKLTDLTYNQLKAFREQHYNASNARILTYGNLPINEHLHQLNEELSHHLQENVYEELKEPISLEEGPQSITVQGPRDLLYPRDQQYKASVTWIMGDTSDIVESFSLSIISSLLLDGFAAPLYQNTIGVGWGASYSPNTGYDPSSKIGMFTIGLNGLKKQDVGRMRDGLENTLRYVKTVGFKREKVLGRLHQVELALKHKTAGFGINLVSRLQDGWFNGQDPWSSVAPEETLKAFSARLEQPNYLENLFEKYWLHDRTFTFIMEPSDAFGDEVDAEEATRLQGKLNELNSEHSSETAAIKALEKQETDLLDAQESGGQEDLSSLPTVHIRDIPRQRPIKEVRNFSMRTASSEATVQWREAPTNGITYFRAIQPIENLPDELRIYLPLYSQAIQRIGTKRFSIESLEDSLRYYTGGVSMSTHSATLPHDTSNTLEGISFSGTALDRNVNHMFNLLGVSVLETDFKKNSSQALLAELIKNAASTAINDVADAGHSFARRYAEAGISPQARLDEQTGGLTQTKLIMDLASRSTSVGYEDVADKLAQIRQFVLSGSSPMRVAMTCGSEATEGNEKLLQKFLNGLPKGTSGPPAKSDQVPYPRNAKSFFPLPYQVYFSALATTTVPYVHADSAPLAVLAQLLTHKYIHPEVREKGGAYGGSAYASALKGTFGFASYRDPEPQRSLSTMQNAGRWATTRSWTARDMEEAKLSVFQSVDAPESVSDEGMTQFLTGITPELEQERRERLLDVTPQQVQEVANRYLTDIGPHDEGRSRNSNEVVLGAEQKWLSSKYGWNRMPLGAADQPIEGNEEEDDSYLTI